VLLQLLELVFVNGSEACWQNRVSKSVIDDRGARESRCDFIELLLKQMSNCDRNGLATNADRRSTISRSAIAEPSPPSSTWLRTGSRRAGSRAISNGKEKPLDPEHNPAAWSKNRNDQFDVLSMNVVLK